MGRWGEAKRRPPATGQHSMGPRRETEARRGRGLLKEHREWGSPWSPV